MNNYVASNVFKGQRTIMVALVFAEFQDQLWIKKQTAHRSISHSVSTVVVEAVPVRIDGANFVVLSVPIQFFDEWFRCIKVFE